MMMMMMMIILLLLLVTSWTTSFAPILRHHSNQQYSLLGSGSRSRNIELSVVTYDEISDIGYSVRVEKPLGVVFGENPEPFLGLVVDDVEPGQNGGIAGLRLGDQLMSINQISVVGKGFDETMQALVTSSNPLELQLFRGSVRSLYTIVLNRSGEDSEDEEESTSEDVVVMDENYESPVKVNLDDYNDDPISLGDVVNAFKKMGSILGETVQEVAAAPPKTEQKTEKSGGIFGMFQQETIQLDGDDASGLKESGGRRK